MYFPILAHYSVPLQDLSPQTSPRRGVFIDAVDLRGVGFLIQAMGMPAEAGEEGGGREEGA